jgi:hypothetical protein
VTRALIALDPTVSTKCGIAGISETDFSPDGCEPNFTDRGGPRKLLQSGNCE